MTTEKAHRHQQRMQRHKEVVDSSIEQASIERGIVIVITGNGKGKTTSALGTLARSLGHGRKCALIQFIKGNWDCGESRFFAAQENLDTFSMNTDFTWNTQDFDKDKEAAEKVWQLALPLLSDPAYDLLVFDEITYMFKYGYLDSNTVINAICNRPEKQNVILTGRGASKALLDIADTVSDIRMVKHAFNQGIKAQPGIEW